MVDDFTEEISSALSAARQSSRGATPTVLIGLGEFGSSCLNHMRLTMDSSPRQLAALSIRASKELSEGITFLSEKENLIALTPGAFGTRSAIFKDFFTHSSALNEWLTQTATGMLAQGASGTSDNSIQVFIIGRSEDVDGSALAVAVPEFVKDVLSGFMSNWNVMVNGFILLPKGRSTKGSQVCALLNELSANETSYNHLFLVADANADGLLDRQASIDLISEFTGLLLEPDFVGAVTDILDITQSRFASFGVTSVVHPANRIINDESARFSGELINSALLSGGGESFYRLADEHLKRERLNPIVLHKRLTSDSDGELVDKIDIDPLILTNVPLGLWPDRIASYDAYFGQERITGLLEKVEDNLSNLAADSTGRLHAKVDELMSEPLALDKTTHFINRLSERVDEIKLEAEQMKEEIIGQTPDTGKYYDDLVKRIKYLPSTLAIVGRVVLLSVLIFYFTLRFTFVLSELPDEYLDPKFVPPALPTALFVTGILIALAYLTYKRADHEMHKARDSYINAVRQKYRLNVSRHAFQVLGWWLGEKDLDSTGERHFVSFKEAVSNEKAAVLKVNKFYLKISDDLKKPPENIEETQIRRSVFSAFGQESDLRYKKGRYNLSDEAQHFAVSGHLDWRNLQQNELSQRLKDFCREGLTFVDNRTLDRLFFDFSRHKSEMKTVVEDLRRSSQPYIAMSSGIPRITELVGISGGPQSALASLPSIAGQAAIVPIWSPHRMAFVQLVCPIAVEQLSAYSEWRQAYKLEPNKDQIDCVNKFFNPGLAA